jgi:oxygen-independent coproporphyrinogen-3 oxidase
MRFSCEIFLSDISANGHAKPLQLQHRHTEHGVQYAGRGDMNDVFELLQRYNGPAPRYTSYPPAPHWQAAHSGLLVSALRRSTSPLSIYVHVPFCERLCLYCGCNVVIKKDHAVAGPYVDHLIAEMELAEIAHGPLVTQMHWGGGTPTYLNTDQITDLFNAIVDRFSLSASGEYSIEIDPRVTTFEHLQTLRRLGFNRVSMGIQDFDWNVQLAVHRIQPYEHTRDLFEQARALGFESINADLIYGLPKQTAASFQKTLDLVLELSPDRLAVFSYAHVPSIKRQQKSYEKYLPAESEKLQLFLDAIRRLTSAGYEHIGMDHFARPGDPLVAARDNGTLHRNFQGYTTHAETDLLGLGVSAISHVGHTFAQNHRELAAWEDEIDAGRIPVFRGYVQTRDDMIRGSVIEDCLCNGRISKDDFGKRFSIDFDSYFRPELPRLEELERDGLIEGVASRAIGVTPAGRIFIRTVAQAFDAFQSAAVASRAV